MKKLFIGCSFDARVASALEKVIAQGKGQVSKENPSFEMKWIPTRNIHLTLKFLGMIDEALVVDIQTSIKSVLTGLNPLRVRLESFGDFSRRDHGVFWIGVQDSERHLQGLREKIDAACEKISLITDLEPYFPHVTLGRWKKRNDEGQDKRRSRMALVRFMSPVSPIDAEINKVTLFESKTYPSGVEYTPIWELQLS